jgi:phosphomannomutase
VEGVHYAEVPTGFKWVVRPGLADPRRRFVFGFEEALGFSVDEVVRDKDGVSAALRFAELAAAARAVGRTVWDTLEDLARAHGEHATRTWSWRLGGPGGLAQIASAMASVRATPPPTLAGLTVTRVDDLSTGGGPMPATDALVLTLADGSRVALRPSGTEPKLKVYAEVVEPVGSGAYVAARERGRARVDALIGAVSSLLGAVAGPTVLP